MSIVQSGIGCAAPKMVEKLALALIPMDASLLSCCTEKAKCGGGRGSEGETGSSVAVRVQIPRFLHLVSRLDRLVLSIPCMFLRHQLLDLFIGLHIYQDLLFHLAFTLFPFALVPCCYPT